jgi:pimeloyl-ACP methyl ester carboxylesterase
MPYFDNEGIKIYYEIEGEGPPVVMLHGFPANIEETWKQTNWLETLRDNYQLILLDSRGHGKSDKPHENSYYEQKITDDVIKLLEHLSVEKANFFGYSMGANITFLLLLTRPEIFISAILGGFVLTINDEETYSLLDRKNTIKLIEALKAENVKKVRGGMARTFRRIAELGENDLLALAAFTAGLLKGWSKITTTPAQMRGTLKKIKVPVMTVVGSSEIGSADKTLVAQLVPDACHFQIQGKDHSTVIPDPKFHMVVKAFLDFVNYQ